MSIIRAITDNYMILFYFYIFSPNFCFFVALINVVNLQHIFYKQLKFNIKIKKCFFATVQKNTFHKRVSRLTAEPFDLAEITATAVQAANTTCYYLPNASCAVNYTHSLTNKKIHIHFK